MGILKGSVRGHWLWRLNPEAKAFFTNPIELAEDLKRVEDGSRVIVYDVSLNGNTLQEVLRTTRGIASRNALFYIDHHPYPLGVDLTGFPAKVFHELVPCASELVFRTFRNELPRAISRIAIHGAIGDYADDTSLVRELLKEWDKRTFYFEAGVPVQGLEGSRRDIVFKHEILKLLSRNRLPSSNSELLGRALVETQEEEKLLGRIGAVIKRVGEVVYVLDIDASVSKAATYARVIGEASVEIAGETSKGIVDMSLRTERDDIDLNAILRDITHALGVQGEAIRRYQGQESPNRLLKSS